MLKKCIKPITKIESTSIAVEDELNKINYWTFENVNANTYYNNNFTGVIKNYGVLHSFRQTRFTEINENDKT